MKDFHHQVSRPKVNYMTLKAKIYGIGHGGNKVTVESEVEIATAGNRAGKTRSIDVGYELWHQGCLDSNNHSANSWACAIGKGD